MSHDQILETGPRLILRGPHTGRTPGRRDRPRGAISVLLAGAVVLAVTPAFAQDDEVTPRLHEKLQELYRDTPGPVHYFAKQADLDSDGRPECIVHVAGPMVCGTGGCNTLVLAGDDAGLEVVSSISVTRPPVVVAETTTNGWRDLVVRVSGGGILPGYDARLGFDGSTYPTNPTVEPAERLEQQVQGKVAIPVFASFREGRLLRDAPE